MLCYVLDWLSSKWIHRVVQNAGLAPRNESESLPLAGEEGVSTEVGKGDAEAAGVVEAQPLRSRTVGVKTATAAAAAATVVVAATDDSAHLTPRWLGRGLGVRTRRSIPGFELVPPTRSIAPVRPPPALFSLAQRFVTSGNPFSFSVSALLVIVPLTSAIGQSSSGSPGFVKKSRLHAQCILHLRVKVKMGLLDSNGKTRTFSLTCDTS